MTTFIFDLQRFDTTTWTLTATTESGKTTYTLTAPGKSNITATTLTELFANKGVTAGDTIQLGVNIITATVATISKNLTVDLNGKSNQWHSICNRSFEWQ